MGAFISFIRSMMSLSTANNSISEPLRAQIIEWARSHKTTQDLLELLRPQVINRFTNVESFILCKPTLYLILAEAVLTTDEQLIWFNCEGDNEDNDSLIEDDELVMEADEKIKKVARAKVQRKVCKAFNDLCEKVYLIKPSALKKKRAKNPKTPDAAAPPAESVAVVYDDAYDANSYISDLTNPVYSGRKAPRDARELNAIGEIDGEDVHSEAHSETTNGMPQSIATSTVAEDLSTVVRDITPELLPTTTPVVPVTHVKIIVPRPLADAMLDLYSRYQGPVDDLVAIQQKLATGRLKMVEMNAN